jgi:hypothetical protein
MKCNVGPIDSLLRIIVGLAVAIIGVVFDSWWGLVGLIPLATGYLNFACFMSLSIYPQWEKKKIRIAETVQFVGEKW